MKFLACLLLLSLGVLLCGMWHQTRAFTLPEEIADDFEFDEDSYEIDIAEEESVRSKRTAGIKSPRRRWTNNTVNYEIKDHFNVRQRKRIMNGMKRWSRYTCIKFQENSTATARVYFANSNRCFSSAVGMTGKPQEIGLERRCRFRKPILHEIGHVLGLQHEQNRPDRNKYVTVNFDNIKPEARSNFIRRRPRFIIDLAGLPYDYYSIMHYTDTAFRKEKHLVAITTKDSKYQKIIGRQNTLSYGDIKTINIMYKCSKECTLKASDCPVEGFVGRDCFCWCPGNPVRYCDESKGDIPLNSN